MSSGLHEYQSEFVRTYIFQGRAEGREEGVAEGEAKALLTVLESRGVPVTETARSRITESIDALFV